MTFSLLRSTAFIKAAKKIVKKNPLIIPKLQKTLEILSLDPFNPSLKTHKLKGELQTYYACSIDYELRIIFEFTTYQDRAAQFFCNQSELMMKYISW